MQISEAISLIQSGIPTEKSGVWADFGAGTGIFTQALQHMLPAASTIYALDKSPLLLYQIPQQTDQKLVVVEGDFTRSMDLPMLDGIILANALHYASDHLSTLQNILNYLYDRGTLILVEYEQETPRPPWVPFPVSFRRLQGLASELGLEAPQKLHQMPSVYGYEMIYSAKLTRKQNL
ncbi:MAG: class I SAM-dependent methyltransferase [Microscillaceae bacterium]|nr:class I SAM-dependent methyltransferase [Microscillaceae bacterium]